MPRGDITMRPPRHFLRKLSRFSRARAEREFTRWWENKVLLSSMGQNGGEARSPALDSLRLPFKIQRKVNRVLGASKVNTFCSSFPCNHVQRSRQTVSAAESGERFGDQKVHCRNESGRNRVFLESISSAEKVRGFQVSDRSVTAEQITGEGYISNGHAGPGKTGSTSRYVGNIHRSLRCVPSYPNQGGVAEVSMFSSGHETLQVSSSPVRANVSSVGVYHGCEGTEEMGCRTRSHSLPVSRRLVKSTRRQSQVSGCHTEAIASVCGTGIVSELEQIGASTSSENHISGRSIRSVHGVGVSHARANAECTTVYSGSSRPRVCTTVSSRIASGVVGRHIPDDTMGQTLHAVVATRSHCSDTQRERQPHGCVSTMACTRATQLLATRSGLEVGGSVSTASTTNNIVHRRVPKGLGCGMAGQDVQWSMERSQQTHQLVGIEGSLDCASNTPVPVSRQVSASHDRQCNSSGVCQPYGRHEVSVTPQTHDSGRRTRKSIKLQRESKTHRGKEQCVSRPSVKGGTGNPIRMAAVPRGFCLGMQSVSMGQTKLGVVRKQVEPSSPELYLSVSGSGSMGHRCSNMHTARGQGVVCVSTSVSPDSVPEQAEEVGEIQGVVGSSVVATSEVGTPSQSVRTTEEVPVPTLAGTAETATLGFPVPTRVATKSPATVFGEERLKSLGYSKEVIQRLRLSHADSTMKQYQSKWVLFVYWASESLSLPIDPTSPSLTVLADFLTWLFQERKHSYGSINNYRSAIAFHWKRLEGFEVPADDSVLRDLMTGFKRERPLATKKVVQWDLKLVLEFFKSKSFQVWDKVSDKHLTLKTVFLLALASGKRRGEIHALARDGVAHSFGQEKGMLLRPIPGFISKTQLKTGDVGALKKIFIPSLPEEEGG